MTAVPLVLALQTERSAARAFVDTMKTLVQPVSMTTALLVFTVGVLLLWIKPRWGRVWLTCAVIAYWIATSPIGVNALAWTLDGGYSPVQRTEAVERAQAIVMLGGGTTNIRAEGMGVTYTVRASALRVLETARVYRLMHDPLVIVSGGVTDGTPGALPESEAYRAALIGLGVPASRIVMESESRNTREEAIILARMLGERHIDRFVMVTSRLHMSRALATLAKEGLHPVPSPSPLHADGDPPPRSIVPDERAAALGNEAVYEWCARLFYWMQGWTRP